MTRPLALVTGGSRGVGAATARRLAADGWNVVLTYREDAGAAATVVEECCAAGAVAEARRLDLADDAAIVELFATLPSDLGPLRGLVNNAGVVASVGPVADMDADRIRRLFDVNVVGLLLCCREAVRLMATDRGGSGGAIVNVSSKAAVLGSPGEYVDYAASKAAVDTITTGLAKETAHLGVRVNSVRLGLIDTEIHDRNGQLGRVERMAPAIPMQRAADPSEVAAAIAWLLGEESSYSTGAHLDVSGGR